MGNGLESRQRLHTIILLRTALTEPFIPENHTAFPPKAALSNFNRELLFLLIAFYINHHFKPFYFPFQGNYLFKKDRKNGENGFISLVKIAEIHFCCYIFGHMV